MLLLAKHSKRNDLRRLRRVIVPYSLAPWSAATPWNVPIPYSLRV